MTNPKQRVYILDALRGIAVIGMIIHHSYVLLNLTKGIDIPFFSSVLFEILQTLFVSIFLLVSGICTNYSHNIVKRGVIVFGVAIAITLVTAVILPAFKIFGLEIYFGVLHMFGASMLIYALLRPLLNKLNTAVLSIASILLFTFWSIWVYCVPFVDGFNNAFMIFGFPASDFYSADYYPIFPYVFMFVAGTAIGRWVKLGRFPQWFYSFRLPSMEFIGRHSLLIYLLHQPIIFALIILFDVLIF